MRGQPIRWLLWHPHQKLWNWWLEKGVRKALGKGRLADAGVTALITADSVLLLTWVLARRLVRWRPGPRAKLSVLYIDCGTHRTGRQIRWMHRWLGRQCDLRIVAFEASGESHAAARKALADIPGLDLRRAALVGPDHPEPTVRLYKGGGGGLGDSLFAERGGQYETVPAARLSQILAEVSLDKMPVILRMNIEGTEQDVIDDLVAAGLHQQIDGYYGMWDDLSKIDPAVDAQFRRTLRAHKISHITFNDRDLAFRLRRFAIRLDVHTSLRAGLRRIAA